MAEDSTTILKGKRVVVTRAAQQSQPLVLALQEKGAVPVVLPMVAFGPPEDPAPLDAAIRNLSRFDWVFLTSQNAVRAIMERCQLRAVSLSAGASGVRVAAVGPATAAAAEAAGWTVSYLASKHQGIAMAEELGEQLKGKHVLLPRSDKANPELVEVLNRLGAQVTEVVAYRTIFPEQADRTRIEALAREGADAILFFSPSAVHHLQDILGNEKFLELSRSAVFAAIGPVTGEALSAASAGSVVQAGDTTIASVLDALAAAFSDRNSRLSAGVKPR